MKRIIMLLSIVGLMCFFPASVHAISYNYTSLDYLGALSTSANGIDRANIVGVYDNGHGFLATPIPEPSTLLLLGSGLAGLAGIRKKFKI